MIKSNSLQNTERMWSFLVAKDNSIGYYYYCQDYTCSKLYKHNAYDVTIPTDYNMY